MFSLRWMRTSKAFRRQASIGSDGQEFWDPVAWIADGDTATRKRGRENSDRRGTG